MFSIFDKPAPFVKKEPVIYPEWESPEREPVKDGYYRLSAKDLNLKLTDERNFKKYFSELRYRLIVNDGSRQSLVWLASTKNVFSEALSEMPQEYITKLIFNRNHFTVVLIKNGLIIGGICFRPFYDRGFAEIAFCVTLTRERVRGYGSFAMALVKNYLQVIGISHILTYADNSAINYFKRQGFTLYIQLSPDVWKRCIKDYDGATLMHCIIHKDVDYLYLGEVLARLKKFLSQLLPDYRIHQNTTFPVSYINGIQTSEPQFNERNQMEVIVKEVKGHSKSWPFLNPVSTEAPDYANYVQNPMDLSKLERNVHSGLYKTLDDFRSDLYLIFSNCYSYNGDKDNNIYTTSAHILEDFCNGLFEKFKMGHRRST